MKVIVCHPGKQHVNALLQGLSKNNALERFYTMFATNKISSKLLSDKWHLKLQKKVFRDIDNSKIKHSIPIFLMSVLIKSEYWSVRLPYKLYDLWTARLLKKEDYDIVIGYENSNLITFKAAKEKGKITVLDLAGVHHHFQNPVLTHVGSYTAQNEVEYISHRKDQALEVTDYVITLSKFGEQTLIQSGYPANRIFKAYLGIDQALFTPKTTYNTSNTEGGVLNLYFVGTLSRRKGLPFIIDLLKELRLRERNIYLTLIGPYDDFNPEDLDDSFCRYIPFVNHQELVAIHHSLDLFIFPSNIDSWAQVVVEAMACGSPVLVSENTGAKDAVEQGGGFVLPIGDKEAWLKAIESFYFNRILLQKKGMEAASIARQYTWEAYHQQIFGVMTDILARKEMVNSSIIAVQARPNFSVSN